MLKVGPVWTQNFLVEKNAASFFQSWPGLTTQMDVTFFQPLFQGHEENTPKKYTNSINSLEVQPPFLIGWFPNHHYFSRGLSSSKKNHHF